VVGTAHVLTAILAASATARGGAAGAAGGHLSQPCRDLLLRLGHELVQLLGNTLVFIADEGDGGTSGTATTGTTDTVDIIIDIVGHVVVDDVLDIRDGKTTGSDISSDKDRASTELEVRQGLLTLNLSTITVDGSSIDTAVHKVILELISRALGLDEDESQAIALRKDLVQALSLIVIIVSAVLHTLRDEISRGTDTTNGQEDVILEEALGKLLNLLGERSREHEGLTAFHGHIEALDDLSDLRSETHVKHAISLIEDEQLDVAKRDLTALAEIVETTRSSNDDVATTFDIADLVIDGHTTVHDDGTNGRAVGELESFLVDLCDELTSGAEHQSEGIGLGLVAAAGDLGEVGVEEVIDDREEECSGLTGTGLSAGNEVSLGHGDGDGVFLDRGGALVTTEFKVGEDEITEVHLREIRDGSRDVLTGGFDGNVIIDLEIDTGTLLSEELGFEALIASSDLVTAMIRARTGTTEGTGVARAATVTESTVEATSAAGTTGGVGTTTLVTTTIEITTTSGAVRVIIPLTLLLITRTSKTVAGGFSGRGRGRSRLSLGLRSTLTTAGMRRDIRGRRLISALYIIRQFTHKIKERKLLYTKKNRRIGE